MACFSSNHVSSAPSFPSQKSIYSSVSTQFADEPFFAFGAGRAIAGRDAVISTTSITPPLRVLMLWQFSLWWFGLPAILKGWVDRVFAMGRTYGGDRFYENCVFRGKRALLSVTTGGPADAYRPGGFNGDIEAILRPIHRGMLRFTGWDVLAPCIVYGPAHLSEDERLAILNAWTARLRAIGGEVPIDVGEY